MNWYKKAQAKSWENLVTKDQLIKLFEIWGIKEPIPSKNNKVIISFPPSEQNQFSNGIITYTNKKSTYGKPLFKVTLTNELV